MDSGLELYAHFITSFVGFPDVVPPPAILQKLAAVARQAGAAWDVGAAWDGAAILPGMSADFEKMLREAGGEAPAASPTASPAAPVDKGEERFDPLKPHQFTPGGFGGTGASGSCAWCGQPENVPGFHIDEGIPRPPEPPPPGVKGVPPPPEANVPAIPGLTAKKHDGSAHPFAAADEWAGRLAGEICVTCGKARKDASHGPQDFAPTPLEIMIAQQAAEKAEKESKEAAEAKKMRETAAAIQGMPDPGTFR